MSANYHDLNEIRARGTPDFPIELYHIESSHPRYIMSFHWHAEEYEMIRVASGIFNAVVGEESYRAGPGDVLLVRGGDIHGGMPEDCVYDVVVFETSMLMGRSYSGWSHDLLRLSEQNDCAVPVYFPAGSCPVPELAENVIRCLRKEEREGRMLSTLGALYALFGELAARFPAQNGELYPRAHTAGDLKMKSVFRWIEEHYTEPVTLEDMADAAGMSRHYFCEIFKRYTRRRPVDYLNLYRINASCRMLKNGGCSVTDAAFSCGFNDLSYFIKLFKRCRGVTPGQYRKSAGGEESAAPGDVNDLPGADTSKDD